MEMGKGCVRWGRDVWHGEGMCEMEMGNGFVRWGRDVWHGEGMYGMGKECVA